MAHVRLPASPAVAWSSAPRAARLWALGAISGLAIIALGSHLEAQLCAASGSALNSVHALFFGCDLVFLGLLFFLRNLQQQQQQAQQQRAGGRKQE